MDIDWRTDFIIRNKYFNPFFKPGFQHRQERIPGAYRETKRQGDTQDRRLRVFGENNSIASGFRISIII